VNIPNIKVRHQNWFITWGNRPVPPGSYAYALTQANRLSCDEKPTRGTARCTGRLVHDFHL